MTVTVSSGGYAKSVGSWETRTMGKRGGRALTPFSLRGANPCAPLTRNWKMRCGNSGGAEAFSVQPPPRVRCLKETGRIRKPKREPNRRMDRAFFCRVHTHLPEDRAVPPPGLPVHSYLLRIHGTGDYSPRGTARAMARRLPRRTLSPVSSRRLRSRSGTAKICPNGKFVWRCF